MKCWLSFDTGILNTQIYFTREIWSAGIKVFLLGSSYGNKMFFWTLDMGYLHIKI